MSYNWLIPTMQTFISKAEDNACHNACMLDDGDGKRRSVEEGVVGVDAPMPRREMEMTLIMVPSMVWGRVNL